MNVFLATLVPKEYRIWFVFFQLIITVQLGEALIWGLLQTHFSRRFRKPTDSFLSDPPVICGFPESAGILDLFSDNKQDECEQQVTVTLPSGWVAGLGG